MKNGESPGQEGLASLVLDARCPLSELDRDVLRRSRLRKAQTFPRLVPEGSEANTLCLSPTSSKNQLNISEFFPPDPRKVFLEGKNGLSNVKAQPKSRLWPEQEPRLQLKGVLGKSHSLDREPGASEQPEASPSGKRPVENRPPLQTSDPGDASHEAQTAWGDKGIPEAADLQGSTAAEQVGGPGLPQAGMGKLGCSLAMLLLQSLDDHLMQGLLSLHSCSLITKFSSSPTFDIKYEYSLWDWLSPQEWPPGQSSPLQPLWKEAFTSGHPRK
jgi:hypothetical protein